MRQYQPLPRLHQPATWNADRIRKVAADASLAVEELLPRSDDIPAHWRTMHGDFVPWNLREDAGGRLWLLDWEDAGWGPPLADFVRYAVAYHALGSLPTDRIAAIVTRTAAGDSLDSLMEVATFWLAHPNLGPLDNSSVAAPTKDSKRAMREVAVFRTLASGTDRIATPR